MIKGEELEVIIAYLKKKYAILAIITIPNHTE
jgi:hypothetical protein